MILNVPNFSLEEASIEGYGPDEETGVIFRLSIEYILYTKGKAERMEVPKTNKDY